MAFEVPGFSPAGVLAGEDLRTKQYRCVKLDGGAVLAGAGDLCIGVLQNTPNEGENVQFFGSGGAISKVVCGGSGSGTVTNEAPVASDANGEIVDATTGDFAIGIALEDGDEGQIISVLLNGPWVVPA